MNYKKINDKKFSFVCEFKGVLLVLQRNEKYNPSIIKIFCDKNGNYLEGAYVALKVLLILYLII